jgi:hypothetical protein
MTIEKIIEKLDELEEQKKMQEVKEAKMIKETVFIMHPKQKWIVKTLGIKYVIFSRACEEDKIYLITDKDLAQTIRNYQDNYEL